MHIRRVVLLSLTTHPNTTQPMSIKIFAVISVLWIFCCPSVFSQPTLEWVRKFPDTTNNFEAFSEAIAVDSVGNVYIAGGAETDYWSAYCTVKYSPSGLKLWSAIYLGQGSGGRIAWAIAVDRGGNVYVTGYSFEIGRYFDYCTIKYNSNGVQQWVQLYNGPSNGIDEAHSIAVDKADNIYITGFSALQGESVYQVTTIKYAPDGTELWVRRYGTPSSLTQPRSLAIDNDCNIYITGCDGSNIGDALTLKYDSSGALRWAQLYAGPVRYDISNSLTLDDSNNVFVAGASEGSSSYYDFFTIKYSSGGVQQWVRRYNPDSMSTSWYWANSVVTDSTGNAYVSGFFSPSQGIRGICIVKYSGLGDIIWVRKDWGGGSLNYTQIDKDDKIYTGAEYYNSSFRLFFGIKKYDSSGVLQWKTFYADTARFNNLRSMKVDNNFNVYLAGFDSGKMLTIKYSPVIGITPISSNIPNEFKLYQNYPNPFNASTKIKFEAPFSPPEGGKHVISLRIYDILGREVAVLVKEQLKPGTYEVEFDGTNFSSGVYFCRLEAGDEFTETRKLTLIK